MFNDAKREKLGAYIVPRKLVCNAEDFVSIHCLTLFDALPQVRGFSATNMSVTNRGFWPRHVA
jgi:hypothetical protein